MKDATTLLLLRFIFVSNISPNRTLFFYVFFCFISTLRAHFFLYTLNELQSIIRCMIHTNPCLNCGACCAFFRVSFYWRESENGMGGLVPQEMTEDISPYVRSMKGTNQAHPRCVALLGQVNEKVQCSIYEERSSTCSDFGVHWTPEGNFYHDYSDFERCNKARSSWHLAPLFMQVPRVQVRRPVMKHLQPHIHRIYPALRLHHSLHCRPT